MGPIELALIGHPLNVTWKRQDDQGYADPRITCVQEEQAGTLGPWPLLPSHSPTS